MPFETGHVKVGGRKQGTPNVVTKELRTVLKQFVRSELETLPSRLQAMSDEQRLTFLVKLLPYVLPTVDRVSHDINEPIDFDY